MTIADIQASDKIFLTPSDISDVLECDPQSIRVMARQAPQLLGFPFTLVGTRMRIPRVPFLRFIGVDN